MTVLQTLVVPLVAYSRLQITVLTVGELEMETRLVRGERIELDRSQRGGDGEFWAIVQTDGGRLICIDFPLLHRQSAPVHKDESLTLIRTIGNSRATAIATVRSITGRSVWLEIGPTGWREDEKSTASRASLGSRCEVSGRVNRSQKLAGVITDISATGLCIAIPRHVGEAKVDIELEAVNGRVTMPCILLAVEQSDDGVRIKVRYERLSPQLQEVAEWLANARGAMRDPAA